MTDCRSLLARLLAVHLALLGVAAMNTAWAEDAAPVSAPSGKTDSGSDNNAATKGSEKATGDEHAGDKMGGGSGGKGEHPMGSKDAAKGGEETDGRGAPQAEDHTGLKHNGIGSNPIDTRITVFGKPRSGHAFNARDRKKTKIARPAVISDHHRTLIHSNKNNVVRNAIGLPIPQTNADSKGADKKVLGPPLLRDPRGMLARWKMAAGARAGRT